MSDHYLVLMQKVLLELPALGIEGINVNRSLNSRAELVSAKALADLQALLESSADQSAIEPAAGVAIAANYIREQQWLS